MSRSIWTECGGLSNARRLELEPWRVVEAQYVNSTRKLVDSDAEQAALEEMIDSAKPPVPAGLAGLHYLLFTPFRHPPLPSGSRFGRRTERGVFYGSREVETALAEVAYYRLVFLEGTAAALPLLETEHTAFQVPVRTGRGIDLTLPPFAAHREALASRTDYAATQRLGTELRAAGVEALCSFSARAAQGGTNVAVLDPAAFGARTPRRRMSAWSCTTVRHQVELREKNVFQRRVLVFPRTGFLVDGALPAPAI